MGNAVLQRKIFVVDKGVCVGGKLQKQHVNVVPSPCLVLKSVVMKVAAVTNVPGPCSSALIR